MRPRIIRWCGLLGVLALGGCSTPTTAPAASDSPSSWPITVTGTPRAAEPATHAEPLRLTLTLSDGSKIIGQPAIQALPLKTAYTTMEIPLPQIVALKFAAGATNAALTLANGDRLSAAVCLDELRLTTLVGKVTIPLSLVTAISISTGGTAAASHDGLVLWFPFDGVQGQEVADASEHGHRGTLCHGARIVADEGRRRDVLELDGRGAHLRVPGSPDFALTNLTFAVWLKPAEWNYRSDAPQVLLSTVSLDSFDGWEFFIGGPQQICWHCRLPGERRELATATDVGFENDTAWHCCAFTFAYQAGRYVVTTYCDGQPVKQEEHPAGALGYSGQVMHVGINYDSPAADLGRHKRCEFQGRMDDLMLFNRALSGQEIAALYNAQK